MSTALLGVFRCQQDLRHRDVVARQRFLVSMRETNLSGRGGRLFLFELDGLAREAEMAPSGGNRARGDQQHLDPLRLQPSDVVGEAVEPRAADGAGVVVDQQRRTDLDHQALGVGQLFAALAATPAHDTASS
jgi:hypothetical protein